MGRIGSRPRQLRGQCRTWRRAAACAFDGRGPPVLERRNERAARSSRACRIWRYRGANPAVNEDGSGAEGQPALVGGFRGGRCPRSGPYGHRSPEGLEFDRRTRQALGNGNGPARRRRGGTCSRPARTMAGRSSRRAGRRTARRSTTATLSTLRRHQPLRARSST